MHVVNIRIVLLKITLVFVHVNREQRVIHFWVVFQFNIVLPIINVHREQFAQLVFVPPFVHQIANVSPINFAYKAFANRPVTITQHVQTSNSVKITSVHKRFDAATITNVYQTNIVMWIHTVDQNVRMLAKDVFSVAEMLNVLLVIMTLCVHANKVSLMMVKADADELNAKRILIVHQINSVRKIFANWHARVVKHAVKRQFVRLKIIDPFVIVNLATAVIHMNNVMQLIIVVIHHADREPCAQTTKEHSIVLAVMDTLVIHTMKDVA